MINNGRRSCHAIRDPLSRGGDVAVFAACTGARIGEVSGCRVRRHQLSTHGYGRFGQTTPSPGGLVDEGTKGKRARSVPLIVEIRDVVPRRVENVGGNRIRLPAGPRGGQIATAVLRDAMRWDGAVPAPGSVFDQRCGGLTHGVLAGAAVPKWSQMRALKLRPRRNRLMRRVELRGFEPLTP
jgi:integrase